VEYNPNMESATLTAATLAAYPFPASFPDFLPEPPTALHAPRSAVHLCRKCGERHHENKKCIEKRDNGFLGKCECGSDACNCKLCVAEKGERNICRDCAKVADSHKNNVGTTCISRGDPYANDAERTIAARLPGTHETLSRCGKQRPMAEGMSQL